MLHNLNGSLRSYSDPAHAAARDAYVRAYSDRAYIVAALAAHDSRPHLDASLRDPAISAHSPAAHHHPAAHHFTTPTVTPIGR